MILVSNLIGHKRIFDKYLAVCTVVLFVMLLSISSAGAAVSEKDRALVEELLNKAGVMHIVEDIPTIMGAAIIQKTREHEERGQDSRQFEKTLGPVVKKYYSLNAMLDSITEKLGPLLQGQRAEALKRLLSSSPAKQIMSMKSGARTSESLEAIKNMAIEHDKKNIPKERLDLLEELDNATADTEFFIAVQALSIDAILKLTNAWSMKVDNKPIPGLKADVLSSTYEMLLRPSRYTTMMTYRHMFRDTENGEIKQYIGLYRQSHMQWLLRNIMVAISSAMEEASVKAIKHIHAG